VPTVATDKELLVATMRHISKQVSASETSLHVNDSDNFACLGDVNRL
jgi:hypothetical protein